MNEGGGRLRSLAPFLIGVFKADAPRPEYICYQDQCRCPCQHHSKRDCLDRSHKLPPRYVSQFSCRPIGYSQIIPFPNQISKKDAQSVSSSYYGSRDRLPTIRTPFMQRGGSRWTELRLPWSAPGSQDCTSQASREYGAQTSRDRFAGNGRHRRPTPHRPGRKSSPASVG